MDTITALSTAAAASAETILNYISNFYLYAVAISMGLGIVFSLLGFVFILCKTMLGGAPESRTGKKKEIK